MSTQNPDLTLYELRRCPYCAKVRRALDDLGLSYESRYVPGMRSRRDEVKEVSGQYGVPVLVDEDNGVEGMPESDDIVGYLYEEYGDGRERPPGLVSRVLFALY